MARRRRHWFVVAGLIALGHQSAVNAFWPRHHRPQERPPVVIPPTVIQPPTHLPPVVDPANPNPPILPPGAANPPGAAPADLGGNDFLGGQAAGTFTPNMFGDFFGGAGQTRVLLTSQVTRLAGAGELTLHPSHPTGSYDGSTNSPTTFNPNETGAEIRLLLNGFGTRTFSPLSAGVQNIVSQDVNGALVPQRQPFAVNPGTTNVFTELVDKLAQTPAGRAVLLGALNELTGRRTGQLLTTVDSLTLGPVGFLQALDSDTADLIYRYQVIARGLGVVPFKLGIPVANPADGGNVGRTKTSEDNSPFPKDRFFFNYDFYSATRLTASGLDVSRFSAGAEITFFDRQASLEVRVPFASTLSSTLTVDGVAGRDVELGNVAVTAKWLWTRDPVFNIASGLSVALPTANDTVLNLSDGTELLRIKNQTALLTPYLAMSYTPNERFFSQSWVSLGFDPRGNDVRLRNVDGTTQTEKIDAVPIISADTQVGYWLARNTDANALLQGLAPFLELHYNGGANFGRRTASFNGVNVVESRSDFSDFNLTAGFTAQLRNNLFITNGLVVPLGEKNSRFFDWQYGLRMNWLYGPTARATDEAMAAIRANAGGAAPGVVMPNTFSQADSPQGDVKQVQHTEAAPPSPFQQTLAAAPCGMCSAPPETPPFFGDFIGVAGQRTVATPAGPRTARVPLIPQLAGLKVTDNDGPRPADRVYFTYNDFDGAFDRQNSGGVRDFGVTRETIGFESTVFGGYGSFGARLPFVQMRGNGLDDSVVGDLTLVAKLAWAQDAETGSLISSGFNLTLPTGDVSGAATLNDGTDPSRALWLQPWTGYLLNSGRFYSQGVVSLAAPSESDYPVELFTSVGAGYWLVKSDTSDLRGLVPTVELHVNTPLTNRGGGRRVTAVDEANLTAGVNLLLPKMTVGGAVSVPVVGRGSYRSEFLGTVNFRF